MWDSNVTDSDRSLYDKAREVMANAYAPYSEFRVGAALLSDDGRIFTGVNVENASYGATICAERSAVSAAVTGGAGTFVSIAIASSGGEAWPCGICRQVLFEFGEDIRVITGQSRDQLAVCSVRELLPNAFKL